MDLALNDVTVLDLGQVIAMPFCTMLLADMGARVIKVESRDRGRERVSLGIKRTRDGVEERVPAAQYRERNKLGITLELKTPEGVKLFKELVGHADLSMTQRYMHLSPAALDAAIKLLDRPSCEKFRGDILAIRKPE